VLRPDEQRSWDLVEALNEQELRGYLRRVGDRWPLERAVLGGARVDDARGAGPQRERGPEYVVVLVSEAFGGVPWLERVYQASSLWDASEMGDPADLHCYTPAEFERKVESLKRVRDAVQNGYDLLAAPAA
jgi:hypothetical protein